LSQDLVQYEKPVNGTKCRFKQHEFDALVSFVFNVGGGAYTRSTMKRLLEAGDKKGAGEQFLRWNKIGKKVSRGLTLRRQRERLFFLEGKS
jgi:lysozyme